MGDRCEDFTAPMELEHALGYSGRHPHSLVFHPTDTSTDVIVYSIGKLLLFADINDPHKQLILRGHDAEITCVGVSPSGRLVSSGQMPYALGDGFGSIYVWDYAQQTVLYVLKGHKGSILSCKFSEDDRWLISTGSDGKVCVWDMEVGQMSGGCKEGPTSDGRVMAKWATWCPMESQGRRPKYTLCVGYEKEIRVCVWEFSIKTMSFNLTTTVCQVPGSGGGLSRYYNCGCVSSDGQYCLAGTTSGDVVVYSVKNAAYRGSFPSGSNVLSIVCVDPTTFIVGHGDGTLKKVVGQEKEWKVVQEISLVGGVTNLTLAMDQQELIAGTNTGIVYRVLTSDLTFTHLMESHVSTVRRVVFPHLRSDLFVSTGDDGYVKKWDLSDYSVTSSFTLNSNPHKVSANVVPLCASFTPNDALVMTGWTDGFIRGLDLSGAQGSVVWQIVNGHKGAVNVIISATPYFCTAGEDCVVRVWAHQNREQLIQISEHKKPITNIVVDNTTEAIIHTVSLDKYLYTYDIYKSDIAKTAKRLTYHCDIDGQGFSGAAQRRDNEHEMIVGTVDGRLLTYDIDYQQPTLTLTDPSRAIVNSVAISSSGTHLACGNGEGKLHMYDLQQTPPRLLGSVRLHSQDILSVAWSPDEKQLVTCGRDGAICVWNFYAGST